MSFGAPLALALTVPAATIVTFFAIASFAMVMYLATTPHLWAGTADKYKRTVPKFGIRPWWIILKAIWRRSKTSGIDFALISFSRVSTRLAFVVIVASIFCYVILIPYQVVNLLFKPAASSSGEMSLPSTAVLGSVVGLFSLRQSIRYFRPTPSARRVGLAPVIRFPQNEVSLMNRAETSAYMLSYYRIRRAPLLSYAVALLLILSALPADNPSGSTSVIDTGLNLVGLLSGALISIFLALAIRRFIDVRATMGSLITALNNCSQPIADTDGDWQYESNQRRAQLVTVVRQLDELAHKIDRRDPANPKATILYAASARIREHLATASSLSKPLPSKVQHIVEQCLVLVAGPSKPSFYETFAHDVTAFDESGAPHQSLRRLRQARKFKFALLADFIDKSSKLSLAIWTLFTLGLVVALVLTGRLDLTNIQLQR